MTGPKVFVLGWPVVQSRSPLIHGHWLERYGIAGEYRREAAPPEQASAFLASLAERGYVGGNVTIPHKEAAFAACAERTAVAERLGAVNTVWLDGSRLCGGNTDAYGFSANLDDVAPVWRNGSKALVIGAGGASRAVVHAILEAGFRSVVVANRTAERAEGLADLFGDRVEAVALAAVSRLLPAVDLVVNTTSAGMAGREPLAIDWRRARREAIAADIVYVPLRTAFLARAAERGLATVDGLGMLLHQAAPGFERWFGRRPAVDEALRSHILADLVA